jgi:hypothetical protein
MELAECGAGGMWSWRRCGAGAVTGYGLPVRPVPVSSRPSPVPLGRPRRGRVPLFPKLAGLWLAVRQSYVAAALSRYGSNEPLGEVPPVAPSRVELVRAGSLPLRVVDPSSVTAAQHTAQTTHDSSTSLRHLRPACTSPASPNASAGHGLPIRVHCPSCLGLHLSRPPAAPSPPAFQKEPPGHLPPAASPVQ